MAYKKLALLLSYFLYCFLFTSVTFTVFANTDKTIDNLADINVNWQFTNHKISETKKVLSQSFDDSTWKNINLPHDWSIKDIAGTNGPFDKNSIDKYDTGYTNGGIGWYRKKISLSERFKDQIAILEFGGIYMNSEVYINGKHVGGQHYGYTSFWLDITQHLRFDEDNILVIKVNNKHLNSRWYSGSGIYRPVSLTFKPKLHIKHWGTVVTTPIADKKQAQVNVSTELVFTKLMSEKSKSAKTMLPPTMPIELILQVIDDEGHLVAETVKKLSKTDFIQSEKKLNHEFTLNKPKLWAPSQPHLYTLKQLLKYSGKIQEVAKTSFGIRELLFSAQQGFSINGEPLLLKGMNIHHGNYLLGAEAHKSAEIRKVKRILAAGYNAVRTAHNPPSQAFLVAADQFGLLVINEAFDAWNNKKSDHKNDYSSQFKQDWQRDLTNFIKRDRNHPSVIMWSLGNEIPEQNDQQGADTAAMLKAFALSVDNSREITIGANTSGLQSDPYLQNFSVVGYNYQEMNYASDHQRFPKRVMYGSETYSNRAFEYWQFVESHPYIIGDFVWTGWDYLGEASIGWTGYAPEWKSLAPFPWTLAYSGEIDALGFKRPSAYYRDVLWKTGKNKVSAFVKSPTPSLLPEQNSNWYLYWTQPDLHPSWTWPEAVGKKLDVEVYSALDSVELFLNGKSLGKKVTSIDTEFKATYQVAYEQGQLKAVGYSNGVASDEWLLTTAGSPSEIRLVAEHKTINADGKELVYITAELFDDKGQRVYHWHEDIALTFNVSGAGHLLAVGNANPRSVESFTQNVRKTFRGRVVAVVQSIAGKQGKISVSASAKELATRHTVIYSLLK
ncbi:MAG: DUF4982 domain-containing protein [Colwellia sp.]